MALYKTLHKALLHCLALNRQPKPLIYKTLLHTSALLLHIAYIEAR